MLGDRLGLWAAMAGAGPVTPGELAARRGGRALCAGVAPWRGRPRLRRLRPGHQRVHIARRDGAGDGHRRQPGVTGRRVPRFRRAPAPTKSNPSSGRCGRSARRSPQQSGCSSAEDAQGFGRAVARFFASYDAFLTPTMSTPPLPVGTIISTPEDPWRSLEISGQTVRYAGVAANITGSPRCPSRCGGTTTACPSACVPRPLRRPRSSAWHHSSKHASHGPTACPRCTPPS